MLGTEFVGSPVGGVPYPRVDSSGWTKYKQMNGQIANRGNDAGSYVEGPEDAPEKEQDEPSRGRKKRMRKILLALITSLLQSLAVLRQGAEPAGTHVPRDRGEGGTKGGGGGK